MWPRLLLPLLLGAYGSSARNSEMAEILHRPMRAVSYPANSNMGIFLALAVPLADPYSSVSLSYFFEANYALPDSKAEAARQRRSIDRATVYAVVQSKFESAGQPGRECLLRSICETAEQRQRTADSGVLGDVMRVLFTPSSSRPEDRLPDGVVQAELSGRNASCAPYQLACPRGGLFDLIAALR